MELVMVPASELVMVPKLLESTALLMMLVLAVVKVHANLPQRLFMVPLVVVKVHAISVLVVVLVVVKVHANSVFVMVLASVMAIAQRLRNDNASRRAHNRHLHPMVSRGGLQR